MKATSSLPHFHTHLAGNAPTWSRDNPDAPGRIRTSDQQLRRLLLYPPELRARVIRQQLNTRVRLAARSRALLARRLDIVSILLHAHATLARSCDGGHSSCIRR